MLKRRIIPIELLLNGRLVKTKAFETPRDVGDPVKSSKVYSDQDADELVLINIDSARGFDALVAAVSEVAKHCFVPLTVGGGVAHVDDAARLFEAGADKVLINSMAYGKPELIADLSSRYGRQAVVVGVDVRKDQGDFVLCADQGRSAQSITLESHLSAIDEAGAGEVFVQRVELDGAMTGYDLELLRRVVQASRLPIIAAAGAGNFLHIKEAFDVGVDAAACGSLFNFGDNNPLRAKAFLKNHGVPLKKV